MPEQKEELWTHYSIRDAVQVRVGHEVHTGTPFEITLFGERTLRLTTDIDTAYALWCRLDNVMYRLKILRSPVLDDLISSLKLDPESAIKVWNAAIQAGLTAQDAITEDSEWHENEDPKNGFEKLAWRIMGKRSQVLEQLKASHLTYQHNR